MKILFVHQNFPGQFVRLAPALEQRGHDVMGMADSANKRRHPVKTLRYQYEAPDIDANVARLGRLYAQSADRGSALAKACRKLYESHGYVPDVIVGHSGWGETLFLKHVWPDAKLIAYAEFYYRAGNTGINFDPEFSTYSFDQEIIAQARAAHMAQSLIHADAGLTPTMWQASVHPPKLREMINVIHDGIDTDAAAPNSEACLTLPNGKILRAGDEVLTFMNRNLEPYRGYHIFMRALPEIMRARPNVEVVLIGGDEHSYGPPPDGEKGWKERILSEVRDQIDMSRVHFLGKVPYPVFLSMLQVSRVHAYLTYPFVLSWSMMEAMSAECLVVASKTPPVEELITDGETGILLDFFDVKQWANTLIGALAHPERYGDIRKAARAYIRKNYDLRRVCLPKMIEFVESFDPDTQADRPSPVIGALPPREGRE